MPGLLKKNKYRLKKLPRKYAGGGSVGDPKRDNKYKVASYEVYGDNEGEFGTVPDYQPGYKVDGIQMYAGTGDIPFREALKKEDFRRNWINNVDPEILESAGITSFRDLEDKSKVTAYQTAWNDKNKNNKITVDGLFGEQTFRTAVAGDDPVEDEVVKEIFGVGEKTPGVVKGIPKAVEETESKPTTSEGGSNLLDEVLTPIIQNYSTANREFANKFLDDLRAKNSGSGAGKPPTDYNHEDKAKDGEESSPGSGPPPSGSSTHYSHPRVSINNTTNLDTESASTQGKENKLIETLTDISNIKYPEGGGDDSKTTSVTTRVFKPKIFGEGLRRRGTEINSSETLNADGTRKSYTYSKNRIRSGTPVSEERLVYKLGGKVRLNKYRIKKLQNGGTTGDPKKSLNREVSNWSSNELKEYLGEKAWEKIQEAIRKYPMDVDHNAANVERYAYLNDPDDVDYDPERYIKMTTPKMGRSLDILNTVIPKSTKDVYGEDIMTRVGKELKFAPYNNIKLLKSKTIKQDPVDKELQTSTSFIPTSSRKSTYGYKLQGGKYGQVPTHRNVWNDETKKWMRVDLEPEEIEYYKKQNLPQEKQIVKASFNYGGKVRLLKK